MTVSVKVRAVPVTVKEVPLFKKVAEHWLEYKKANVRESTWNMYRGHVENHFEYLNDLKINRITVATVKIFIARRREQKVSLPTLRKVLLTFGQVMKFAVRHRLIDHNPVSEAERPEGARRKKKRLISACESLLK